jgi:hypothetical protein
VTVLTRSIDLRTANRDSDDTPELDVISQYEQHQSSLFDAPAPAPALHRPVLPRSRTEPRFPALHGPYALAGGNISPAEEGFEEAKPEGKGYAIHTSTAFDFSKIKGKGKQPASFHVQSPLQHVENSLLDAAESAVNARKTSMTRGGSGNRRVNTRAIEEDRADREEHNMHGSPVALSKMKWQQPVQARVQVPSNDVEDRWLTDAEVKLAEMQLEEFKLAAMKSKANVAKLDAEVATMKKSHEKMKKGFDTTYIGASVKEEADEDEDEEDLASLRSSINLDEEPTVHVAKMMTFTRVTPGMVKLVDIPARRKKPTEPAREGAVAKEKDDGYVKGWVADYNPTLQRPVEECFDDDVLASREVAPAPFPKE